MNQQRGPSRITFPIENLSLAATGDVWLELMRNVQRNGGRQRGRPGSLALRFHGTRRGRRGRGGASPDAGRVIDLEVPICSN